ncbi:hypothetical protein PN450_03040 [Dolichospermum lemmermannii CS-548]|uniref:hypothetical protein n=1 Tax=Dolichospermum lemmermannii TaxID=54295 RepID=UPI00232B2597|nr:hypothetical protein [Dolichospermum lemmermannii]MDB9435800.1 hypothetical protein [Dolichospermum lemmermannii CS-548]
MSVGAKHLEDKLSVIAKNSSPNASPVQLSVVSCQLPITNHQLPITNHQSPITNHQLPFIFSLNLVKNCPIIKELFLNSIPTT